MNNTEPKKDAFIFSVYRQDNPENMNLEKHVNAVNYLKKNGFAFKELVERFTYYTTNKEVSEQAIYVQVNSHYNIQELQDFVVSQCRSANQESYLRLSPSREVELIPLSGEPYRVGVMTCVNRNEAEDSESSIYCPTTGNYFICK